MNKRKVCFIMTIVGLLVIITTEVFILIDNDKIEDRQTYLEENLINQAKKCVRYKICEGSRITLRTLKESNLLEEKYLSLLDDYSLDSYISYPDYKLNLRKIETALEE